MIMALLRICPGLGLRFGCGMVQGLFWYNNRLKDMKTTTRTILLSGFSYLCLASAVALGGAPAFAQEVNKIDRLEAQLEKALSLIEAQSQEMKRLQGELSEIKARPVVRSTRGTVNGSVANRLNQVEETLKYVEETVYEIDDRTNGRGVANVFDAERLNIGGFFNTAFTYVDGEDGSAKAFNRQNFELLIRADLDENWSAFFAGGFLREGDIQFTDSQQRRQPDFELGNNNPQIIGWFNYKHNDQFNVRLGRLITPHGIINIEHFPATLLDQEQPQFLRPFRGDTIFPNFSTGVETHGRYFFGQDILSYSAYVATSQGSPEELLYGGRVAYQFSDYGVTVGLNGLTGTRDEGAPESDYNMIGADLLIDKGPILWKTEIYATDEQEGHGRFAFYTQPAYRFTDKWIGFYRYDVLNDGANAVDDGSTADDNESIEHVIGLNYLPKPNVRLRLTGTRREFESGGAFEDAEADIYQFSATYSF